MADLNARIKPKKSSTVGEAPQAADLEVAELAINTADGKLFTKHTDGSVVTISGGGGGGDGAPVSYLNVSGPAANTQLLDISQYSGSSVTSVEGNSDVWDLTNSASFTTSWAKFSGGALECDGNNGYLAPASTSTLEDTFAGDCTFALWVNKTGNPSNSGPIFDFRNSAGDRLANVWVQPDGSLSAQLGGSGDGSVSTGVSVANGEHHIALVRSGTTITLYVDGAVYGSLSPALRSFSLGTSAKKGIGAYQPDPNTYNFAGQIADVAISHTDAVWTSNFTPPDSNVSYFQATGAPTLPSGALGDLAYSEGNGDYFYATGASSWNQIAAYPTTLTPTDSQVLAWNGDQSQWEPSDDVIGATSLVELTDTNITAPSFAVTASGRYDNNAGTFPDTDGTYWVRDDDDDMFLATVDSDAIDHSTAFSGAAGETMQVASDAAFSNILFEFAIQSTADQFGRYRFVAPASTDMPNPSGAIYFRIGTATNPTANGSILVYNSADNAWEPSVDHISKTTLKAEVAASTDFTDFQARIAAL